MVLEEVTAFTERCYIGEPASCSLACPFQMDIRAFIDKAQKGRWQAAYKAYRGAVVFPAVVSTLCAEQCKTQCQRTQIGDEPIDVRRIEQACIRLAKSRKPETYVLPPKTEHVAVVGAGTAGLSCALSLAQKKYNVTVFEREKGWGGKLRAHPRFDEFDEDFALQFSVTGTVFEFDTEVNALNGLSDFDAIYVATGAYGEDFGLLGSFSEALLSTDTPNVFLGGALTGADTVQGIIQGVKASKIIETFLQTGKAFIPYEEADAGNVIYIDHSGEPGIPLVKPESDDGYSESEARAEAARCFKCDCDRCMTSCEMLGAFRKNPKKIAMEVYSDTKATPPYSTHTLTREAYSCNMCGQCKSVCPVEIDVGALLRISREARIESEKYPEAFHDYWLREMDYSTGEASYAAAPKGVSKYNYVYFPGCRLGAHNSEYVLRSYDYLQGKTDAGVFLHCCGAPAFWAGDKERFCRSRENILSTWLTLGEPTFVFACATCESVFKAMIPEVPRISIYEIIAGSTALPYAATLAAAPAIPSVISSAVGFDSASVFDPCNSRGENDMEKAVRTLAGMAGIKLVELAEKNICCGYGGHMSEANPKLYEKITANRAALGETPYIVYCVNCKEVFISQGKDCTHILDVVFGIEQTRTPDIYQKRMNTILVKKELMKKMLDKEFEPEIHEWDSIELIISGELLSSIDKKLISLSEVKEAVWLAETTGDKFVSDITGECRCSMEKPVLTYWVDYIKSGDTYEVRSAYFHRMKFSREDV